MKKKYLFAIFSVALATIMSLSGCKKEKPEPIANFTFTGAGKNAPCEVTFTNTSTNATSYSWKFGDGATSTEVNPKHTYTSGGTFTVTLTATGEGGTNSISKKVQINDPVPIANFTFSGAGNPAPCEVVFTNTSTNATSYSWDFGDGSTSTEENPTHTYMSGGTFTVSLTAIGPGGENSISKNVNISDPVGPVANFTFSGAGGFAPCTVTFTNTSTNATSYSWDFGDGTTSTAVNPSHTYNSGGIYSVTLTATSSNGSNSITKNVNIEDAPTKIQINQLILWDYPQTDDGSNWDYSAGPDIYWKIMDEDMTTTYFTSGVINDAVYNNLPFYYNNGLPYTLTDLNETYVIVFYDKDSPDADDFMGGYYFTPSDYTTYPSTISFYSSSSDLEFDLEVTWSNDSKTFPKNSNKIRIELQPIKK